MVFSEWPNKRTVHDLIVILNELTHFRLSETYDRIEIESMAEDQRSSRGM